MQIPTGALQITPDIVPPHALSPPALLEQPKIPNVVRHAGLLPPHRVALAAEHSVHAPASGPLD